MQIFKLPNDRQAAIWIMTITQTVNPLKNTLKTGFLTLCLMSAALQADEPNQ